MFLPDPKPSNVLLLNTRNLCFRMNRHNFSFLKTCQEFTIAPPSRRNDRTPPSLHHQKPGQYRRIPFWGQADFFREQRRYPGLFHLPARRTAVHTWANPQLDPLKEPIGGRWIGFVSEQPRTDQIASYEGGEFGGKPGFGILEYVLATRPAASALAAIIRASIGERRRNALADTFVRRDFRLVQSIYALLPPNELTPGTQIKHSMANLPFPIAFVTTGLLLLLGSARVRVWRGGRSQAILREVSACETAEGYR